MLLPWEDLLFLTVRPWNSGSPFQPLNVSMGSLSSFFGFLTCSRFFLNSSLNFRRQFLNPTPMLLLWLPITSLQKPKVHSSFQLSLISFSANSTMIKIGLVSNWFDHWCSLMFIFLSKTFVVSMVKTPYPKLEISKDFVFQSIQNREKGKQVKNKSD